MDRIGLQAVFEDAQFQAGLSRYVSGLSRAEGATQRAAGAMTAFGHTISTALGTAIGMLSLNMIPKLTAAFTSPISATQQWGGQLHDLADIFGLTDTQAAGFTVALNKVGIAVDDGMAGFSYFTRQVATTKEQLSDAASTYATATGDIASAHADAVNKISRDWQAAQADAADSIATVWQDLAEKKADIEMNMADQIANINEGLQERLSDIADQRNKLEQDTARSLSKLTEDTRDRLRNARSARERRQIRKDAAEQKTEILRQAAERKAELDKQEAREKAHAAKQIALAEKVAAKQIEAAEKAADKQTAAIEKALAKQQKAMQEQIAEADKAASKQLAAASKALSDVKDKSPLSKALKALGLDFKKITNESRPFVDRMGDIMDAFSKLPEGVDTSAIALQLFGKSGLQWLDFLRQGRKGLEDATQAGIDLGLVFDPQMTKDYSKALRMLDLSLTAISVNIGKAVLPMLGELAKWLNDSVKQMVPFVQKISARIAAGFKAGGLEGAAKEFWKALTEPSGIFDQLGAVVTKIRDWFTTGDGSKILAGAGSAVSNLVAGFSTWLAGPEGTAAVKAVSDALGKGLQLAIEGATWIVNVMTALVNKIQEWIDKGGGREQLAKLGKTIALAMLDGMKGLFISKDGGASAMGTLSKSLSDAWNGIRGAVVSLGTTVATGIISGIASFFFGAEAGTRIQNAIYDPFRRAVTYLTQPGGPIVGLVRLIFEQFQATWEQLFSSWNPFAGLQSIGQSKGEQAPGLGFASGGWVPRTGPALVHAGEYVLNRQQAMAWAPVLSRPNMTSNNFSFSHTWNGAPASFDRREVERIAEDAAYRGLSRVLPGR